MDARLPAVLMIALGCAGCAASRATINSYVDPTYTPGTIESIAVFPIRNARFAPSDAQQINRRISMAIHFKNEAIQIMSSTEAVKILNDHGLADDWAVFLAGC